MKVNILNNHEVVLVEIPDGGEFAGFLPEHNIIWYQPPILRGRLTIDLPPGEWSLLGKGTASQVSEKEAFIVADLIHDPPGRKNMRVWRNHEANTLTNYCTALESLHSYIRANGKEPGNIVIVYRKKNLNEKT